MENSRTSEHGRIDRRAFIGGSLATAGALLLGGAPAAIVRRPDIAEAATAAWPAYQSGFITTIAGGGPLGDGGPATSAALSTPFGVSLDAGGNLYAADNYFHRIYMVAAGSGLFSTVAGTGVPGYSGDGGAATMGTLNIPYAVASDGAGTLYIADSGNACIRRVDKSSGIITTVAGTGTPGYNGDGIAAGLAQLNSPRGVALDANGNLYIADTDNARVRVVNLGTQPLVLFPGSANQLVVPAGQIATVAGTGTAGFSGDGGPAMSARVSMPMAMAFDSAGRLYIADYYNQRVRAVDAASSIITTVAGVGIPGEGGDGGPATSAHLMFPTALALDTAANLYIAQQQSGRVRVVDRQTGIITTFAGGPELGFGGDGGPATSALLNAPTGVATDPGNNVYIADYNNARVRRVDATTKTISTVAGSFRVRDLHPATSAVVNEPGGISFDAKGNLFFADQGNHRIRAVALNGYIITVAGTGASGFGGDGGIARHARLNLPIDVQLDAAANMYIAEVGNFRIRRVDPQSHIITTVVGTGQPGFGGDGGPATAALLNLPRAIALDANGNLYIADINNQRIRFVNMSAQPVTVYSGSPNPLTVQPGDIVTIAGTGAGGSSGDGGPALAANINQPRGVVLDGQGNIFITEGGRDPQTLHFPPVSPDSRIRRVDGHTGIISTVAGTDQAGYNGDNIPATQAELNGPRGAAVDAAGNLFIADCYNNRVRRVDAQTQIITTVVGTGAVGFSGDGGPATAADIFLPRYVALDHAGNLYVTDMGNSRLRVVGAG